jgi:hypothetical protein
MITRLQIKRILRQMVHLLKLGKKNYKSAYDLLLRQALAIEFDPKTDEHFRKILSVQYPLYPWQEDSKDSNLNLEKVKINHNELSSNVEISVCLVIVFNHRYDDNFEKLEALYQEKFDEILFLVPFYRGNKRNVIPVYESSSRFQGYVAQAYEKLKMASCSHYIFIGDDLLINPRINSANVLNELKIGLNTGYIKSATPLSDVPYSWTRLAPALGVFFRPNHYVNYSKELPIYADAFKKLNNHGMLFKPVKVDSLVPNKNVASDSGYNDAIAAITYMVNLGIKKFNLPYPLVMGYSDFFVLPKVSLDNFVHLCGVFAAMDLFVEVAIPTALLLSLESITFESNTTWKGTEIWGGLENVVKIGEKHQFNLDKLLESFGPSQLYIHPVKLSKWV